MPAQSSLCSGVMLVTFCVRSRRRCILRYVVLVRMQTASSTSPQPNLEYQICYSTKLQANCLAIHEFGKDLEAQIGKLQFLAVLVFAAYASGLTMIVTNHPVGAEALLPVGASGRATDVLYHVE